jgi:hypothetical protein
MRSLTLAAAFPALFGCTSASFSGGTAALETNTPAEASTSERSAIGAMKMRDYKVTWLAGNSLRVENAQGAIVADGITLNELSALDPFLHNACAGATGAMHLDTRLDARVATTPRSK